MYVSDDAAIRCSPSSSYKSASTRRSFSLWEIHCHRLTRSAIAAHVGRWRHKLMAPLTQSSANAPKVDLARLLLLFLFYGRSMHPEISRGKTGLLGALSVYVWGFYVHMTNFAARFSASAPLEPPYSKGEFQYIVLPFPLRYPQSARTSNVPTVVEQRFYVLVARLQSRQPSSGIGRYKS